MLKRISVLTVLLLYLVTASGFALNLHYCGNIITSVKIDAPVKKCSVFAMSCCHDKHVEVKIKDVHQGQSVSFSANVFVVYLPVTNYYYHTLSAQEPTHVAFAYRSPPNSSGSTPVYIRNRVFRI
jgi:hypothetical protein